MDRRRIAIVIPALNEAATITSVVVSCSPFGIPIVVDDGSCDETSALARASGATVVTHNVNRGYDQAINSGFIRAAELCCDYVITMDADGQHDPNILESFISALCDGADVVVGYRDRLQRISEHVFAFVATLKWGIRDPLCGMKAYRIGVFQDLGHFDSYESIGTELTLYAVRCNKRIAQLQVRTRNRIGTPRFGRLFSANKLILRALWLGLYPPSSR